MTGIFPSTRRGVSLHPNISCNRTARMGRSGVSYSTRTCRSARDRQMGGGPTFELALLFPGEERVQRLGEIEPCDPVERRQLL